MKISDVLIFDTETTGIPGRNLEWKFDYEQFPKIVQIGWVKGDVAESHIIRPEGWDIPSDSVEIHGITQERAMAEGEPFAEVMDRFLTFAAAAPLICGHNIHFDTSIVKANILTHLGCRYYDENGIEDILFKGKRIDTMRPSMKWVDARMANGRVKFPNLSELYSRCFPGETFPAHDALADCKAVARCLPILVEKGIVELKVREYNEDANCSPVAEAKTKDDKLPIEAEQAPQIEKTEKITASVDAFMDKASDLLADENF